LLNNCRKAIINKNKEIKVGTYEIALKRRSIRRFKNIAIPYEILEKCVNAARLAPSAANLQPLEYIIVDDEQLLPKIFDMLKWAKYIAPAGDPPPGHRPMGYIVVLVKEGVGYKNWENYDAGLAVENMILVALEEGIGSCCLGSIDINRLRELLNIPEGYIISLVLALGYPDESPVVEEFRESPKFWKDKDSVLHVPKRGLKEILHRNKF